MKELPLRKHGSLFKEIVIKAVEVTYLQDVAMSVDRTTLAVSAILVLAVILSYAIGFYIGSGYTVEVRYFVSPKPSKLTVSNFTSPQQYPLMLVSGLAYRKVFINTSQPLKFLYPPNTEGNITCRIVAGYGYYECFGTGYVYEPIGRRLEIVPGNEVTKYYYSGMTAGTAGTHVILYGYKFSLLMLAFMTPVVSVILAYATLKCTYGRFPKESVHTIYVLLAVINAALIYAGGVGGVATVPEEISLIKNCLFNLLYLGVAEVLVIYAVVYYLCMKFLWRRK